MNQTIKETLTKFILKTGKNWVSLLLFVLLHVQCTPHQKGFSPFEIMFGRAPPLLPRPLNTVHAEVHNHTLLKSLQVLQSVQSQVHQLIKNTRPTPLDLIEQPTHPFQPGDSVLVKKFATSGLTPRTIYSYSDHTHRTQGGRTNSLDTSHPREGSPAGGTMEDCAPIPRFTKAKTYALFTSPSLPPNLCCKSL
ncbi:LOW QUALITY PROTEIN: Gag-Pol polyprotein [Plecturocebus cupreus]